MKNNIPEEINKESGIYAIKNLINNKMYIGSTKNFRLRYNKHYFELVAGKHPSKHLLSSFNKHGKDSFNFEVLEVIKISSFSNKESFEKYIIERENFFINKYRTNEKKFGYNLRLAAETNRGIKHAEDALTKVKGKKLSQETKNKMSKSRIGEKHHSAILKEKDIKLIKLLLNAGFRNRNIANYFKVSKSIVNDIKNNGAWKHIIINQKEISDFNPSFFKLDSKAWLDQNTVLLIKYLLKLNISKPLIVEFTNIPYSTIKGIEYGKIYKDCNLKRKDISLFDSSINKEDLIQCEMNYKNNLKKIHKSKALIGSLNPISKLTEESVRKIVELLRDKKSLEFIAKKFNVGIHTISKIKTGKNWSHLTGINNKNKGLLKGEEHPNFRHSDETVLKVIELAKLGKSTTEICKLLNLEKTFVNRIKAKKIRKYLFEN